MKTPNMSGRTDAPTSDDDHLDPSDLLGEDGTVDTTAVKSLANMDQGQHTKIYADECARLRERLASEQTTSAALAAEFDYGSTTIRTHATGKCSCDCDAPPVRYDRSERTWVVRDE